MINYTRKRRDSTSSAQTTTATTQPELQSRRRSLRNVPTISSMIKSTSLRSIDTLDGVTLTPSTSRPITRRQSLTRATASSLAKMVNFTSSSSDNALLILPSTGTSKQPSRLNKLLKKKRNQHVNLVPSRSCHYGGVSLSKKQQQQQQEEGEEEEAGEQSCIGSTTESMTHKVAAATTAIANLPSPPATPLPRRRWSPFRSSRTAHEGYSLDDDEELMDDNKPPQLPVIDHGSSSMELPVSDHKRRSLPPCLTPSSSSAKKRHSIGSGYYTSSSSSTTTTTTTTSASIPSAAAGHPRPSLSSLAHRGTSTSSKLKSCAACPRREKKPAGPDSGDQTILNNDEPIQESSSTRKGDREIHWSVQNQQQNQNQPGVDCGEEPPHEETAVLLLLKEEMVPKEEEEEDSMTLVSTHDDDTCHSDGNNSTTEIIHVASAKESETVAGCDSSDNDDDRSSLQVNADSGESPVTPLLDDTSSSAAPSLDMPSTPTEEEEEDDDAGAEVVPVGLSTPVNECSVSGPAAVMADSSEAAADAQRAHISERAVEQTLDRRVNAPVATAVAPDWSRIALMQPLRSRATLVPAIDQSLVQIVASCIAHADKLESLATDLSQSEDRVSKLLNAHQALIQSLDAREHRYMMHVQTYERLLASQARMIAELEAIQGRLSSSPLRCWQPPPALTRARTAVAATATTITTTAAATKPPVARSWWPVPAPSLRGTILSQHKNDLGYTTDIVVAGICVAPNPPQHLLLAPQDTTTPTLYHHYLLHIKHEERSVKYALCPVEHWVPDEQADSCQHLSCQTVFTLFTRRHHCRSCGHVVCNSHSRNRLPLFKLLDRNQGEWARVCDACFYRLLDPN